MTTHVADATQSDLPGDGPALARDHADSSGRVGREESLRKTGRLQIAVFNSVYFSSITTDEKGLIQLFNVGAERMLGYSAAEVVNRLTPFDISDLAEVSARASALSAELGVAIRPGFKALVFKASLGVEDMYEWTYLRKDGSRLPALVSVTALRDREDGIIGYLLIGTDNSARKKMQTQQAGADAAPRAAGLATESPMSAGPGFGSGSDPDPADFLSQVSRELRAPLAAVNGFARLLQTQSAPATPDQDASTERMLAAGWTLLAVVNNIIDLAVVESGRLSLSDEPVLLADIMRESELAIEPEARRRNVSLTVPLFEDALLVRADRNRLKQVFINLLSNAIRYNRPDGSVVVQYAAPAPGRIRISVRDTGAGLSLQQLAQLFQPFNRLGQESGDEAGAGIGLTLCKRLMELMGGSIGVDSIIGKGSVFWVELNAVPEPDLAIPIPIPIPSTESVLVPHATAPGVAPGHTLLYVEDDPANMELVRRLIARRPEIRLLTAVDGTIAIDIARNDEPDVILMDINLPGISGIQTLEMLHRDPLTAHIPVVALSANAMPADIRKGLEAGFFQYLTKPIKLKIFTSALDAAFEAARVQRPAAAPDAPAG